MVESIGLKVRLRAFVRRDTRARYIASCPSLNVYSQGRDAKDARRALQQAVELWFESCIERGALDRALVELGFRPAPWGAPISPDAEEVAVVNLAEDAELLGEPSEVEIEVPAYQAAALLNRSVAYAGV